MSHLARSVAMTIATILAVLQLKGDGYFPFPTTWPQPLLLAAVLVETLVLVSLVAAASLGLLATNRRGRNPSLPEGAHAPALPGPPTPRRPRHRAAGGAAVGSVAAVARSPHLWLPVLCMGSLVAAAGLHWRHATVFGYVGFNMDARSTAAYLSLSLLPILLALVVAAAGRRPRPFLLLGAVALGSFVLKLVPLAFFPITGDRSDLLPVIKEGALSVWRGESPYRYYVLENGVPTQNVRLPGLLLAYLPAAVRGVDLRAVTLVCEALLVAGVAVFLKSQRLRPEALWRVLAVFLLFLVFPYWHLRHELYEAPFWLLLFASLLSGRRAHLPAFTLSLGLLIATHQWGWLFAPLLVLGFWRAHGFRRALVAGAGAALLGGALLAAFVLPARAAFAEHVFGYYEAMLREGALHPMSLYFTFLFQKLGLTAALRPLQVAGQLALWWVAFRYADRAERMAAILALALTWHLLFNPVAWTYQYLLVVLLLILGLCFREGGADEAAPPGSAGRRAADGPTRPARARGAAAGSGERPFIGARRWNASARGSGDTGAHWTRIPTNL